MTTEFFNASVLSSEMSIGCLKKPLAVIGMTVTSPDCDGFILVLVTPTSVESEENTAG